MFQTILAATDHVTERDPVVETAAQLAAANHGRLLILHVLESAAGRDHRWVKHDARATEGQPDKDDAARIHQHLRAAHREALSIVPGSQIGVAAGCPWVEILRRAHQEHTDLIVMGPHRGSAFTKGGGRVAGQVGSTAEGVIRREKCPVMIVNAHGIDPIARFGRILVGIDFSEACECALCFAGRVAKFYGARLWAFHMLPIPPYPKYTRRDYEADQARAGERLQYFCREYLEGTDWTDHIQGGVQPHRELLDRADKVRADLIVLGSHTRQSEGKWYPGSVVERVSYRATCPVVVINDPEALQPWGDLQASLVQEKPPKDRRIHVFTGRTISAHATSTDL